MRTAIGVVAIKEEVALENQRHLVLVSHLNASVDLAVDRAVAIVVHAIAAPFPFGVVVSGEALRVVVVAVAVFDTESVAVGICTVGIRWIRSDGRPHSSSSSRTTVLMATMASVWRSTRSPSRPPRRREKLCRSPYSPAHASLTTLFLPNHRAIRVPTTACP